MWGCTNHVISLSANTEGLWGFWIIWSFFQTSINSLLYIYIYILQCTYIYRIYIYIYIHIIYIYIAHIETNCCKISCLMPPKLHRQLGLRSRELRFVRFGAWHLIECVTTSRKVGKWGKHGFYMVVFNLFGQWIWGTCGFIINHN